MCEGRHALRAGSGLIIRRAPDFCQVYNPGLTGAKFRSVEARSGVLC